MLSVCILLNNLTSGLLPDSNLSINILSQNILAYVVGLSTTIYYFYYIYTEHDIKVIEFVNFYFILIVCSLSLVLLFILPYTITNNLVLSRNIFLVIPILIITIVFFNTSYQEFIKWGIIHDKINRFRIISGIMGLFSIYSLPIIMLILGDNQDIEQSLYTLGFLFLMISYYLYDKDLSSHDEIQNLTPREKEIFIIVVENPEIKYVDLSEQLHISEKTFSAHMSNIYKKLDIRGKKELLKKYPIR
ncbi:helix-turn-helix transcriptional regulator [Apibacter sp. HY039]|uniref:helix-turn-helix domain-containing protein n=1 Tax=Apibacter sp. HY039 TaxID=2501476 RepID=UPI0013E2F853|nr:helix-turn-helix transcriptional regulator [Apibacter sp. HY039]